MNRIDLEGRFAVVTGGAAGIGLATAQRMVDSGARVALWDRDQAAAQSAAKSLAGEGHLAVALDVSSESDVAAATRKTMEAFGTIDIMVCGAGITGPNRTVADYGFDDWRKVCLIYTCIFDSMFLDTCKRLRIMKSSDAIGLGECTLC